MTDTQQQGGAAAQGAVFTIDKICVKDLCIEPLLLGKYDLPGGRQRSSFEGTADIEALLNHPLFVVSRSPVFSPS